MSTLYLKIKEIRLAKEFTQQQIADKLQISRTSYIALEQGKRDPTLAEVERLGRLLGFTIEELSSEYGVPDYSKYLEMIILVLGLVSGDGKTPKTKLAKILYLADFAWFYEYLKPMSAMSYRKIEYGPVPDQFFRAISELQDSGDIQIEQKEYGEGTTSLISLNARREKIVFTKLSKEEIALIKLIVKKWDSKSTRDIVQFTHEQVPYRFTFHGEIIPYELITQEEPEYVY